MKKANHKVGSANSSTANHLYNSRTSRTRSTSQKSIPKIKSIDTFLPTDSPYKNSLSEINKIKPKEDDSDDFRTPLPIRKAPKLSNPQCKARKKTNFKSTKNTEKNDFLKTTEEYLENSDVNPENLQMALALSRSTFEAEHPTSKNETEVTNSLDLAQCHSLGNILEKFVFKSNTTRLVSDRPKNTFSEVIRKRKNSRFRYITPTLLTRTNEDREALITTKISFVLRHIESATHSVKDQPTVEIFSRKLKEYYSKSRIIRLNLLSYSELQEETYLVKTLNLPITESCCGCHLKKWEDIPGREKSPNRFCETTTESDTVNKAASNEERDGAMHEKVRLRDQNCVSPDLFGSDDESSPNDNENQITPTNEIGVTSTYKSKTGIEHFESVCDDSSIVPQQVNKILINNSQSGEKYGNTCTLNSTVFKNETIKISTHDNFEETLRKTTDQNCVTLSRRNSCESPPNLHEKRNSPIICNSQNRNNFKISNSDFNCNAEKLFKTNKEETHEDEVNFISSEMTESFQETILIPTEKCEESIYQESFFPDMVKRDSCRVSLLSLNNTDNLNVTDYINELLNKRNSEYNVIEERLKDSASEQCHDSSNHLSQITNSQDYIVISDEELNYCSKKSKVSREMSVTQERLKASPNDQCHDSSNSQISSSQESIVISDEELNYSSSKSKETKNRKFYDFSSSDDEELKEIEENIIDNAYDVHSKLKEKYSQKEMPAVPEKLVSVDEHVSHNSKNISPTISAKSQKNLVATPPRIINEIRTTQSIASTEGIDTPKPVIIKTKDVTPMTNYDEMNSPQINVELDKFGLKPLKRRRGIQLLKYIYESTHPFIDIEADNESNRSEEVIKRRKLEHSEHDESSQSSSVVNIVGDLLLQNEIHEDLIFERKMSKKIQSCAVPLQIVWYNFVNSNPELHKNILLYEPLQLEVIHSMLKDQSGCKFKLEDLINFLDKKCITFRTSHCQKK